MEPFKNKINEDLLRQIADATNKVQPDFKAELFIRDAQENLHKMELKARVDHVAKVWRSYLPDDYRQAIQIVLATLPPAFEAASGWGDTVFITWIHSQLVQVFGLDHLMLSLNAMVEITQRGSCEFAVRPYLKKYPKETYLFLQSKLSHPSSHVRRWISEGTRPRLPWGEKLDHAVSDPTPNIELLKALRYDRSKYVQTSVANHLGDIAKDHPDIAINLAAAWISEGFEHADWIAKRALRHLIKQGNKGALKILGYADGTKAVIKDFSLDKKDIAIGDTLTFEFLLKGKASEKLNVDYAIYFATPSNKLSRKVFKLKSLTIENGQTVTIKKKHVFKPVTTRTLAFGKHMLSVLVNGEELVMVDFLLHK